MRHAVLRRARKCLWLLKRLTRNRQKTATGPRHTVCAQLCSVWVGSAFCVMRTSLGTPRAGALLFAATASHLDTQVNRCRASQSARLKPLFGRLEHAARPGQRGRVLCAFEISLQELAPAEIGV